MEIKPTKLVKGKGWEKLLVESNYESLGINLLFNHGTCTTSKEEEDKIHVHKKILSSNWYKDILYFLQNLQSPPYFDKAKARSLKLKDVKDCNKNVQLFCKDPTSVSLNCIDEDKVDMIIEYFHKGFCEGHHH